MRDDGNDACNGAQEATNSTLSATEFGESRLANSAGRSAIRYSVQPTESQGGHRLMRALQPPESLLHTLRYRNPALSERKMHAA